MKTVFQVIKDYINSTEIGNLINISRLNRSVYNQATYYRGEYACSRGTVYTYISRLKALGYLEKESKGNLKVVKHIPDELKYKDIYDEYTRVSKMNSKDSKKGRLIYE